MKISPLVAALCLLIYGCTAPAKTITNTITVPPGIDQVVLVINLTNAPDLMVTNLQYVSPAFYSLAIPNDGDKSIVPLSPDITEYSLTQIKQPDPAALATNPLLNSLATTAVGMKRRVLYAPLSHRDLLVKTSIYLPVHNEVGLNPAIHVNQVGYMPSLPKKAMVGYYMGSLGELPIPTNVFQVVRTDNGAVVYAGTLTLRPDVGYSYQPTPYQQVYEADFSTVTNPGEYRVVVPGMGWSLPFLIDDGVSASIARTYALGLYNQRCGTDNVIPFSRFTHDACHTAPAEIPNVTNGFVNYTLNDASGGQMSNIAASYFPFVRKGAVDVSGGHHDAGDYSKYTVDVAWLIHYLEFAADDLPGVGALDNVGIPESGDGISDVLQEAKWESDFLVKMQDTDGGFYFLVYPRNRPYELDVLPDHGDPQVVFPKNTVATAAAVAALAEMASSPAFKAAYPKTAAQYLSQAILGWQFLTNAFNKYGRDKAYQKITFYGDTFGHNDELAWAAAALFAATGDAAYDNDLREHTPNPNDQQYRQWTWWSMYAGYGCAFRDYAFAARSGRLPVSKLNPGYIAACEGEIRFAATNMMNYSAKMAYGSSFSDNYKGPRNAGWYFSGEQTFDLAVAYALEPKPDYLDVILKNYNYELGCNPVNMSYVTGLGWNRQHEIVDQYANNDGRSLPPDGIPIGNIQAGFDWLQLYKGELSAMSVPSDSTNTAPYPYYDRWSDTFNTTTEFCTYQQAKSLAAAAMLMASSSVRTQAWRSGTASIMGIPITTSVGNPVTLTASAPGLDLSKARITWEAFEQYPGIGQSYQISAKHAGVQWVEMEAQLPDGRRVYAVTNFAATLLVTNTIEQYQTRAITTDTNVLAWCTLDSPIGQTSLKSGLAIAGNATIDRTTFTWSNRTNGACMRVYDLGDKLTLSVPVTGKGIAIEAMLYVNAYTFYSRGNANLFALSRSWNAQLGLEADMWTAAPFLFTGTQRLTSITLPTGQWVNIRFALTSTNYSARVNGVEVYNAPTSDLKNWPVGGNAGLEIGNFNGWVDEIVVRQIP